VPTNAPSRTDVQERLRGLLSGRYTREEVSLWAMQWVAARDPGVEDEVVWRALTVLVGADVGGASNYLYFDIDFQSWLDELGAAMDEA